MRLWANEPYRFFPLAWVCGLVVWMVRYGAELPAVKYPKALVGVLFGFAALFFAFAALRWSPWAGGVGLLAFMGAASVIRGGWRALRTLWPPLLLIAISLPLPLGVDTIFMLELKKVAVTVSSSLLDLMGIVHVRSGTVLELPATQLLVEDACSGIQSFMAVAAFAALIFVLEKRPWWHWLLLSVFASMVVIAANVLRITMGTFCLVHFNWDLLSGTPHLAFGAVIFVVELLLVLSFDRFLAFFEIGVQHSASGAVMGFQRRGEERAVAAPVVVGGEGVLPLAGKRTFLLVACLAVFGLALGARGVVHFAQRAPEESTVSYGPADYPELKFELPKVVGGWTQGESVPAERSLETIGLRTKIWMFTSGDLSVLMSIDYPFDHFHDLLNCYTTAGWATNIASPVSALTPERPPIAYLNLARRGFDRTEVWYANCYGNGEWAGKSAAQSGEARNVSFWDRVLRKTKVEAEEGIGQLQFRVQLCWTGLAPLLDADRTSIQQLFEEASARLAEQVKTQLNEAK